MANSAQRMIDPIGCGELREHEKRDADEHAIERRSHERGIICH
jgi:hypothetical protein